MSSNQTQLDASDIFLELLEVAIHNVLYTRNLYPRSIYTPKKKYGVAVYQAIHPEVVQYISECLKAVEFYARKNQLKKVFLCFELDGIVLEKFVFDLLQMQGKSINDTFLVELESTLRTFMLKLHSCQVYLQNIENPESTFSIQIETSNVSSLEFNENPSYQVRNQTKTLRLQNLSL
ncbi:mitotic spindle assembly checkpoint protein MAD2B-like [Euwallacea fornicatus]|uniref:mitotic spindle assembly checkpoint protein MAD2B-like n=1 Tax=Euwallacea fornicatus TaxID=995702 RepID=UPI00338FD416